MIGESYDASAEEVVRIRKAIKDAGYALTFRIETGGYELHPAATSTFGGLTDALLSFATATRKASRLLASPDGESVSTARIQPARGGFGSEPDVTLHGA